MTSTACAAAQLDPRRHAVPRIGEVEAGLLTDDLQVEAIVEDQPAVEVGDHVAGEPHPAAEGDVDAVTANHLHAAHELRLAGQQPRCAHAVAADVHQRASLQIGAQAHVSRIVEVEAEGGADEPQAADRAGPDELHQARGLRVMAIHERLHEQTVVALGQVERRPHVGLAAAQRLLAQHVLARLQRPAGPLQVQRVGQRDVDGVDVRIGQQRLIAVVGALDPALRGVPLGPPSVTAGDGQHRGAARLRHALDERVVDPRGGKEPPLRRHVGRPGPTSVRPCGPPPRPAHRPPRFPAAPHGWA